MDIIWSSKIGDTSSVQFRKKLEQTKYGPSIKEKKNMHIAILV
jgi:hypothetical protein